MKRANFLIPAIAQTDNLLLAFYKAQQGKSHSRAVRVYRANLSENTELLKQQIMSGKVAVGNYRQFTIYEPKQRQISAPAFNEQVLHHALMNICHPFFDSAQIFDSYASRPGKGVHAALRRAQEYARSYPFYLKLDVRKFFDSIHHSVLKTQLLRQFKDRKLLHILYCIIDSYETEPNRGVPIGNLSSQYFANHFLTGLDRYIKETLRIKAYVRYMDDMVLWHSDKETLKQVLEKIRTYINNQLLCEIKPPNLNLIQYGLPFLGYLIFPHNTRLLQNSKRRFIHKINQTTRNYENGYWSQQTCSRSANSLLAFARFADTIYLRQQLFIKQNTN
ncbi:MAG: reverse transcriptase [Sphingobacteriales bacterium]|nr:MAG: reverse transcriptase [Sphingobacteriales bacterium]